MLRILGRGATLCDGLNRREILRAGGLSLFNQGRPYNLLEEGKPIVELF